MIDIHEVMKNTNDAIKSAVNEKIINDPMIIVCRADREVMLCEQVLRMCRDEASQELTQYEDRSVWSDASPFEVDLSTTYRAKPKKELVVPWEWLAADVFAVEVMSDKQVFLLSKKESDFMDEYTLQSPVDFLNLDLEGIDLPVTVKRP